MSKEVAVKPTRELESAGNIGIRGLSDFDESDLPIPFVKLVQPTSKKVELASGEDAAVGTFYFSRNSVAKKALNIIVLHAKKDMIQWEGDDEPTNVYRLLAVEKGKLEPFTMLISGTSMWEWRNMLGLLTAAGIENVWDRHMSLASEKREGEKGKWYVIKFTLEGETTAKERAQAEGVLDRFGTPEQEETELEEVDVDELIEEIG